MTSVYLKENAELVLQARAFGKPLTYLTPGEVQKTGNLLRSPIATDRAWDYYVAARRLPGPVIMAAALEKTYDGIIVGAGHHGLVLGSYLAEMRPRHPAGRPPAAIRRRAGHRGGDRAGLLSQPAFDQSFPHQRDAVVQGPQPRRPRRIHHAALRVRPAASRRLGADLRPRPRGDAGQRRALLQEGRADLPRLEPQGRGDHRENLPAGAVLRSAAAGRARGAAGARATSAATSWR